MRRRLLIIAAIAAILSSLHFADHAIRGELVVNNGLNPKWNHSGWPFNTHSDKPYIYPISFLLVMGLLVGGMFPTLRNRLEAAYWLGTSIVLLTFVVFVHFVGFSPGAAETPYVICMSYQTTTPCVLAMIDLLGLFASLVALAAAAVQLRRSSGHW